jgi:SAM-dependent methyltransferase
MNKTPLITQHNQQQRRYFEAAPKPTMRPADTPYVLQQADEVLRFGNLTRGDRILEVGCGMGLYTFYLLRRGYRVEGPELSPAQVEWFKAFDGGSYGVPVLCADILYYGTRFAGRFDAVIGFFVLHHLHNLPACFSSIVSILNPGHCVSCQNIPL